MTPEHAAILQDQYEHYWTEQLSGFPDGWGDLLIEFFGRLDKLNDFHARDRRSTWVKLNFRIYHGGGGMNVEATPYHSPDKAWTRPQRDYLAQTLEWINAEIHKVCEVCGEPSTTLLKMQMGEGRDRLLCAHHLAEEH
jgi:hypothetical protein